MSRERPMAPSSTDDPLPNCIENQLGRSVQVQFLQDMTAMGLDRIGTDIERSGYFLIRLAFGQELEDFALPAREQVIAIHRALLFENPDIVLRQNAAHFGAKERFALRNRIDRAD